MRVAALYDIHGMAGALATPLAEVEREGVDAVVLGGDAVGGPQPTEALTLLRGVRLPPHWLRGNGERPLGPDGAAALSSGADGAGEPAWTRERLPADDLAFLVGPPATLTIEIDARESTIELFERLAAGRAER